MTKRKRERLEALKGRSEDKQLYAVVRPGQQVTIEERSGVPQGGECTCDYRNAMIGPDGVARVLLPSGKTYEMKGCQCRKAPR